MIERFESSSPRAADLAVGPRGGATFVARRAALAATLGVVLVAVAWALLHVGFYDDFLIVDTPVYRDYGEAVLGGEVPYRDFELEYPPGALPVFVLPALGRGEDYEELFQALMLVCGAAAIGFLALGLAALDASTARLYGAVAFAALAPLLLGPVILTRYDLWPAALTAAALAGFVTGRDRLGFAALGLAVAAKVYPLVILPLALGHAARRRGRREALVGLAVFAVVLAVVLVPFALVASGGLAESLERQTSRPLQLESLGSALLLAGHRLGLYEATVVSTHGSQNLAGSLPDAFAAAQTVLQALAVVAVWAVYAAGEGPSRERLLAASAAAVTALVAFGKVLSPQFLVWLLPLIPLVAGRAGLAAAGCLAAALVLTQLWFPSRYWDVVALGPVAWLVLLRDLVLVGLFAALLAAIRRSPKDRFIRPEYGSPRTG